MTVGERIKTLREHLEMSQVEFATKINVSKQTLYKYENNIITNIPSDKIETAAKVGNISPAYLMGWDNNTTADKSEPLTNNEKEHMKKYRAISNYGRDMVDTVLDKEYERFQQEQRNPNIVSIEKKKEEDNSNLEVFAAHTEDLSEENIKAMELEFDDWDDLP